MVSEDTIFASRGSDGVVQLHPNPGIYTFQGFDAHTGGRAAVTMTTTFLDVLVSIPCYDLVLQNIETLSDRGSVTDVRYRLVQNIEETVGCEGFASETNDEATFSGGLEMPIGDDPMVRDNERDDGFEDLEVQEAGRQQALWPGDSTALVALVPIDEEHGLGDASLLAEGSGPPDRNLQSWGEQGQLLLFGESDGLDVLDELPSWSIPTSHGGGHTIDLALDADQNFYGANGANTYAAATAVANRMEANVYYPDLVISIDIAAVYWWTSGGPSSTNCNTIVDQVGADWRANLGHVSRQAVLFLAQIDFDGDCVGAAENTPGVQDRDFLSYAAIQTKYINSAGEYKIGSHELGHLFNGEHDYADQWTDWCNGITWTWGSIMVSEAGPNCRSNYFTGYSTIEVIDKNAPRISWCAENPSICDDYDALH